MNLLEGTYKVELILLDDQDNQVCAIDRVLELESHLQNGVGLIFCPCEITVSKPLDDKSLVPCSLSLVPQ